MKIMWSNHDAWHEPKAALVPDDYQPTDYDRQHAVAPPQRIDPADWSFYRGDWTALCKAYPCPAPAKIPKVVKAE